MALNLPDQFRYDSDIGFTFVPNLQVRVPHESGGYLVRTDALGFRDHRTPAIDARVRVFVFGDSFTAGDGVSHGKQFCGFSTLARAMAHAVADRMLHRCATFVVCLACRPRY